MARARLLGVASIGRPEEMREVAEDVPADYYKRQFRDLLRQIASRARPGTVQEANDALEMVLKTSSECDLTGRRALLWTWDRLWRIVEEDLKGRSSAYVNRFKAELGDEVIRRVVECARQEG